MEVVGEAGRGSLTESPVMLSTQPCQSELSHAHESQARLWSLRPLPAFPSSPVPSPLPRRRAPLESRCHWAKVHLGSVCGYSLWRALSQWGFLLSVCFVANPMGVQRMPRISLRLKRVACLVNSGTFHLEGNGL